MIKYDVTGCIYVSVWNRRGKVRERRGNTANKWHLFMSSPSYPAVPRIRETLERREGKNRRWKDVANERERSLRALKNQRRCHICRPVMLPIISICRASPLDAWDLLIGAAHKKKNSFWCSLCTRIVQFKLHCMFAWEETIPFHPTGPLFWIQDVCY